MRVEEQRNYIVALLVRYEISQGTQRSLTMREGVQLNYIVALLIRFAISLGSKER
jgi:hypothetical protein